MLDWRRWCVKGRLPRVRWSRRRSKKADAKAALNAFIAIDSDGALSKARRIDAVVAKGDEPRPLAGMPLVVKDNNNVAGRRVEVD